MVSAGEKNGHDLVVDYDAQRREINNSANDYPSKASRSSFCKYRIGFSPTPLAWHY
jgi:hypothetical protein